MIGGDGVNAPRIQAMGAKGAPKRKAIEATPQFSMAHQVHERVGVTDEDRSEVP